MGLVQVVITVAIAYGLYVIMQRVQTGRKQPKYSVAIGSSKDGETAVHRHPSAVKKLTDCASPNIRNIYAGLIAQAQRQPSKRSMGKRELVSVVERDRKLGGKTKKWKYFRLSTDYKWMTIGQVFEFTQQCGSGMVALGLKGRVLMYAPTSREWMLVALSCFSQSMQIITAYDTLGDAGVLHAGNQAGAESVFVRADQLPAIARIGGEIQGLKHVIYFAEEMGLTGDERAAIEAISNFAGVHTLEEVRAAGEGAGQELRVGGGEEVAMVMYTSGSTGAPKGVVIDHGGIMAIAGAIHALVPEWIDYERDIVLSYLPLSHVLAFFVDCYCVYSGLSVGYGSPRTLTEDNLDTGCVGDIKTLRPSVMLGVPQVWNTIRASILREVAAKPRPVQAVFHAAVAAKTWLVQHGLPTGILDRVVFKKTREATGGNLKIAITGGAPINAHVQRLISAAICPMIQGYGMTEMSGLVSVQIPGDTTLGNIGPPVPSVECKLVDVPEASYFARNGEGEMWLRGPSVFKGYLDDAEETRRTLTDDGWVRTGDVARWTEHGQLAIIDRRKNLVKLAHGEYVALEALEAAYRNSRFVANVCVCADSRMSRPVAIVNIDGDTAHRLAREARVAFVDAESLVEDPAFVAAVLRDLQAVARECGLTRHERVCDVRIDPELWTPENGMLTAASKLKRRDIHAHNDGNLKGMLGAAN